jgi:ribosomal protein L13
MLGKSRMGRKQLKKLKVYKGSAHPHDAQKPRPLAPIRRTAAPRTTEAN